MKNIVDQLPAEIARQIHPDRRGNEAAYWAVRDRFSSAWEASRIHATSDVLPFRMTQAIPAKPCR
jgi:hypothetical protein